MKSDADAVFDVVSNRLPGAGVDAIMIGGHAVNHYGVSRATVDIDFMIAIADEERVRRVLLEAGFTNISAHETVVFASQPGSALRVDFLKVDRSTLNELLANAVKVDYFAEYSVWVPQLRDLLAMKIFSLLSGGAKREDKDFSDIVHLVIENDVDIDADLKQLCDEFGTEQLYAEIYRRIGKLRDA